MVEVRYRGRLGNQLFEYVLGRIIAESLGYALQASPVHGFPRTFERVDGHTFSHPPQLLTDHLIDLNAVLADRSGRKIVLDGWFQRQEFYTPHRTLIRDWLKLDPAHETPCTSDLVVHVRRTDYLNHGYALPFSYYQEAIRQALPHGGSVTIVTDDRRDPFFRRFRAWNPHFFTGSELQAFSFMTHASRLVISASTFSWWPAFLGHAGVIICPEPQFGPWAKNGGDKISLMETDGFTKVPCADPHIMTVGESLYQQLKAFRHRAAYQVRKIINRASPPPP